MPRVLPFALAALLPLAGCIPDRNYIPHSQVIFSALEHESSHNLKLRFTASLPLTRVFPRYEHSNQVGGGWVKCSLTDDRNFSVHHHLPLVLEGTVQDDPGGAAGPDYSFVSSLSFSTWSQRGGENYVNPSELKLQQRFKADDVIPCKVVITAWGFHAYYSGTFHIPAARLLEALSKNQRPL